MVRILCQARGLRTRHRAHHRIRQEHHDRDNEGAAVPGARPHFGPMIPRFGRLGRSRVSSVSPRISWSPTSTPQAPEPCSAGLSLSVANGKLGRQKMSSPGTAQSRHSGSGRRVSRNNGRPRSVHPRRHVVCRPVVRRMGPFQRLGPSMVGSESAAVPFFAVEGWAPVWWLGVPRRWSIHMPAAASSATNPMIQTHIIMMVLLICSPAGRRAVP